MHSTGDWGAGGWSLYANPPSSVGFGVCQFVEEARRMCSLHLD